MMVGLTKIRIMQGLMVLETQQKDTLRAVEDYNIPNVSDKVLRIILSYTDYVNRQYFIDMRVWMTYNIKLER